ncbi:MAG TPA: hypothetical protein VK638_50240 [Edaphobacter sp.]|nr:hypothetical protein [Edaphobacter sp.]
MAIALALIFFAVDWWDARPKPWSSDAITAKIGELTVGTRNDDLHFMFAYALTNNTKNDYRLPSLGTFARKIAETSSVQKVPETTWEDTLIPAHQTVTTIFDVTIHPTAYGTTTAEFNKPTNGDQPNEALSKFANRRLKEFKDGFAFMDYGLNYRIELPQNWAGSLK